jgi:Flp pilus assembly protein TadG
MKLGDLETLHTRFMRGGRPARGPSARGRSARGQSVAELALILPALLLLLLSILQIGFLIFTQLGLTNAAREASRNAASIPVANTAQASAAATEYYARLTNATDGFLKRNVGGYDSAGLGPGTRVCYYSIQDASGAPAIMASVAVQYKHPIFIPFVAPIIDGWDGTDDGGVTLTVVEDIRVGNLILSSPGGIGAIGSATCVP